MGKVRVVKIYEEQPTLSRKTGKLIYVVRSSVNIIVDEDREFVVKLFSDVPVVQGQEYPISFNDYNIRIREPKSFVQGIPGVSISNIPNSAKNPK